MFYIIIAQFSDGPIWPLGHSPRASVSKRFASKELAEKALEKGGYTRKGRSSREWTKSTLTTYGRQVEKAVIVRSEVG